MNVYRLRIMLIRQQIEYLKTQTHDLTSLSKDELINALRNALDDIEFLLEEIDIRDNAMSNALQVIDQVLERTHKFATKKNW